MDANETWQQADQILDRLLDLPDDQRDAALAGFDLTADLREATVRLLAAHRRATGGLDQPLLPPTSSDALCGRRVGRWVLEKEIGSGGMAVVYRARSAGDPDGHVVALKLLRLGTLAGTDGARFREEQRLLARLRHPHIVTLIDSGVDADGTPWLATALVNGVAIDRWCRERRLDVRQRVRLVLAVCAAVDHAHRNLIIHRDLKPSNILVDEDGHVRLLDFGIARLAAGDSSEPTAPQQRMLTPQYAAPEQFSGAPASTAIDVYGVGAVLYALLAGRPPRGSQGPTDTLPLAPSQALRNGEAFLAADLARARADVSGDLDAIALKALAQEPERRYASVAELATDLSAWMQRRPVSARAPSAWYRAGKFLRRHWFGTASLVAVLVALGAGAVAVTLQMRQTRIAADRALVQAKRADAVRDLLVDLFKSRDPTVLGGTTPDLARLLEDGRQRVLKDDALPPESRIELLEALATIHSNLGQFQQGSDLLEQSLALAKEHPELPAAVRLHPRLQQVQILNAIGRPAEGLQVATDMVKAVRAESTVDDQMLGSALVVLTETRTFAGAMQPADHEDAAEAVRLMRALDPPRPLALGNALHAQAMLDRNLNRLEDAETAAREAIRLFEVLGDNGRYALRSALVTLGAVLSLRRNYEESLALAERGLELTATIYGEDSLMYARTLNSVGAELSRHGRYDEAARVLNKALERQRALLGDNARLAPVLHNLATVAEAQARYPDARAALTEARRLLSTAEPANGEHNLNVVSLLAVVAAEAGDTSTSEALFDSVEQQLASLGPTPAATRVIGLAMLRLARARIDAGRIDEARSWLPRARPILIDRAELGDRYRLQLLVAEGTAARQRGDRQTAEERLASVLVVLDALPTSERFYDYEELVRTAAFAADLGKISVARRLLALADGAVTESTRPRQFDALRERIIAALRA